MFEPVNIRLDCHQGLTVALVVSAIAFVAAVVAAKAARATDTLVLLLFVAVELVVGVYAVTRIVGPIQFYLVQWISAVGFVLWLAVGNAAFEFARVPAGRARWRGARHPVVRRSCWSRPCASARSGRSRRTPGT